ncbi:MAG TPA: xanthine dehydrogenase family protein subunit M [Pseudogracilibacillus sp.]|nr:xanthine dehydrogenase family protein subunit M [Pseudogracilibacillus sp.]
MIPATFDYVRPDSVEKAIQLLQESNGEGVLIAGGHSLLPLMKFRITEPGKIIDISRIPELKGVRIEGDKVIVGAMTSHVEATNDPIIKENIPVLSQATSQVGDIQIRNSGTVGGNIAHGDPVADLTAPAFALDAELIIRGEDGQETMSIDGFILGPLITMIPENSVIVGVRFSIPPKHAKSTYLKYFHPATGYPVVGVAAVAGVDESGKIDYIRIGITGVGEVAYRASTVEEKLLGTEPTFESIQRAAQHAAEDGDMGSDLFASAEYRENLAKVYVERALTKVLLG